MREDQLDKIHGIFKPEKMEIRPSVIKVPKELSLNWEIVGRRNNKEGVTTNIFKYFMPRDLKGSENHFFTPAIESTTLYSKCQFSGEH